MTPVTTTISRNSLQRVLDASASGTLGVTFQDDGSVTITDTRLDGLALTIERPTWTIELPAPAIDVATLTNTEPATPIAELAPEPQPVDEFGALIPTPDVAAANEAQAPAEPVAEAPIDPTVTPPEGQVFTTSSPDVVAPAEVVVPAPDPQAPDLGAQADPAA